MLHIQILCVGRIRERYLRDAIDEYTKRLGRYAQVTIREVADEPAPERLSGADMKKVKDREGERLLEALPERTYVIALAIRGRRYTSEQLSEHIDQLILRGNSSLTLIIGGSLGLSEAVLQRSDEQWSFSDLTFPHQLMRVILLEQLYRCMKILSHEPYHK